MISPTLYTLKDVSSYTKDVFHFAYRTYQNETFQNFWGLTQCCFGILAIRNLTQFNYLKDPHQSEWKSQALKIIDLMGNISMITFALISRPALTVWKWSAAQIWNPVQVERFFNCPRFYFIVSIGAYILGAPSTIKFTYNSYRWISNTCLQHH